MQKHTLRAICIFAVLLLGALYIYPTIGWMSFSDETRAKRTDDWREEDTEYVANPGVLTNISKSVTRWAQCHPDWVITLGLDLQGGIHMIVGLDMDKADPELLAKWKEDDWSDANIKSELQEMSLRTIRRRINEFEAKEPVITKLGDQQIQILLPGEKDLDRAKRIILKAAVLKFHIVAGQDTTDEAFLKIDEHFQKTSKKRFIPLLQKSALGRGVVVPAANIDAVRALVKEVAKVPGLIPDKTVGDKKIKQMIAFGGAPKDWDKENVYQIYLMNDEASLINPTLTDAVSRRDESSLTGSSQILFGFDAESGRKFGEITEAHIGEQLAVVVDDVVESAPNIQSKIMGSGSITGSFSPAEGRDLAIAMRSGSMPVPIQEDFSATVGATLGRDLIKKGVTSSLVGLVSVILFMLVYYRIGGLVACAALICNALLVMAALAYFGATLTLPGIAGLILTIGMAVDANVLIFERIREELRNGKSLLASIDGGYARATVTILDANVTTLIAAVVLMQFGTGPIEGFAITLSIGVCTSVFTALIVTRALLDFMTNRKILKKLVMMSVIKPDTKIEFMGRRRFAFAASGILIGIGVVFFALRLGGVIEPGNFGVDFTTGTNMQVRLDGQGEVTDEMVRERLGAAGFNDYSVSTSGAEEEDTASKFLIRVGETSAKELSAAAPEGEEDAPAVTETISSRIQMALADLTSDPSAMVDRVDTVGPAVGKQLTWDAIGAIAYALVFIVAYLWFRFEMKFALGAVAALVHDVLITMGLFALFGRQISLPVVAAILTIIGYSLNDTIVVFDRVREDLRLYRGRGLSYPQIMNLSVNQTLSRTLLTSLTTLFVVVVLFIFGGDAINDFAFALIIGVIVGTYSSVFVASPVVYFIQKLQGRHLVHTTNAQGGSSRRRKKKAAPETSA
jgi:protein-export membrane protein SecD/preprotein translocase SecF subunit